MYYNYRRKEKALYIVGSDQLLTPSFKLDAGLESQVAAVA